MTLVIGTIYNETVQIIADSAETIRIPTDISDAISDSSFGEKPSYKDGYLTIEKAQKIYLINNSLVTFSGAVSEGIEIINDLKKILGSHDNKSLHIQRYFEANRTTETEFLIGLIEKQKPTLFYTSKEGNFFTDKNLTGAVLGSGSHGKADSILERYQACEARGFTADEALILAISILQAESLYHQSLKFGHGGYYNGAFVSSSGISWAKDTLHILYSGFNHDKGDKYYIYRFNRNTKTFIASFKNQNDIFETRRRRYVTELDNDEPSKELFDELTDLVNNYKADYYVLICYDRRTIVVIDINKDESGISVENKQLHITGRTFQDMFQYYVNENGQPHPLYCYIYTNIYDKL